MCENNIAAIILAAGQGKRMNSTVPKQYLQIQEKPVLYYSLMEFEQSEVNEIILVVGKGEVEYCKTNIVDKYNFHKVTQVLEGGTERYHSVYNGLCAIKNIDYVLIHDGARPFVDVAIIQRTIEAVKEYKACVVGMPVKDTIKIADTNDNVESTPARDRVWIVQTPQAFAYPLIKDAYNQLMEQTQIEVTDDAMVLEQVAAYPIKLIEGSYRNIKITTPDDIQLANLLMVRKEQERDMYEGNTCIVKND